MELRITDTNDLSAVDVKVLKTIVSAYDDEDKPAANVVPLGDPARPKATVKTKPVIEPEPPVVEPEPPVVESEQPVVESEQPVVEPEQPVVEPEPVPADEASITREEAITLATKAVAAGRAAQVKAALTSVGAKKVSEIPDDDLARFVAKLSASAAG